MKRIRINNDFTFAWAIERNGLPEDLSGAINMVLQARNSAGAIQTITAYEVTGNIVSVEVTPEIANVLGRYNFILTYELPDASLDDMERLCEVDTDAFIIVPRTAEADDSTDLLVTSDMTIGFKGDSFQYSDFTPEQLEALKVKGDKGDAFQYSDFTPEQLESLKVKGDNGLNSYETWLAQGNIGTYADYLAVLQLPATEAAGTLTTAVNAKLGEADTAIQNANTKAGLANDAASLANEKAGLADSKATLADQKATLANDAATLANTKAGLANTAATNANNAIASISPSVINNEQVQSEIYNVLNARITALEELLRNMTFAIATINKIDVVDEFNIWGTTNLIKLGTTAPAITPDFIGQTYINTTAPGTVYTAKGINNSGDWRQTSN